MKPRTKSERIQAIRQIIETMEISTQEDLIAELEKLGYEVTQATISRDIGDMGLLKVKLVSTNGKAYTGVHAGRQVYSLPQIERLRSLLNEFMISIDRAENQIVLKTTPGMAQAVAAAIDAAQWQDVLGTVGGDDTILIIARNKEIAADIAGRMTILREEKTL
jgi:transcriptional regulator of arginine metabolism